MTRITEWVLGIFGAIAAFMGGFILYGGENEYIGLAGDLSWRVGDIDAVWGYGLLIGGVIVLAGAVALFVWERRHPQVRKQLSERAGLITHIAVFVLVNGLLWAQDIASGGGLEYAYWTTIPWGVVLMWHVLDYLSTVRRHTAMPRPTG